MEHLLGVSAALTAHMMLSSFQLLNHFLKKEKHQKNYPNNKKKQTKREERLQKH